MSETVANIAQKNARNAMQRVEALEEVIPNIVSSVSTGMGKVQQQVNQLAEVVEALVSLAGTEAVQKAVMENRKAADVRKVEAEVAQLAKAVETGALKTADAVADNCVLVFAEYDKEGKPLEVNGRSQFSVGQLQPQFKDELMGKKVGATITSPEGHKFEVKEIYAIQPQATEKLAAQAGA